MFAVRVSFGALSMLITLLAAYLISSERAFIVLSAIPSIFVLIVNRLVCLVIFIRQKVDIHLHIS